MPAGTITLTNNSVAITGSGTSFTTELKANDFIVVIVGGVTYTLGVQSVNSATGVTLATAYNGPTASGVAWTAVPNAVLVGITAQMAADVAKAIRGLNLDKANWQQIFSASGNITVTLPDGSQFTGTSWNNIASTLSGKVDKSQNLNDVADKSIALGFLINARTPATIRGDLKLGSAATVDVYGSGGTAAGQSKIPLLGSTYNPTNNTRAFTFASANTPAFSAATGEHTSPLVVSNGNNNSAGAAMVFIRDGNFANYFGIDQDNQWAHGGWSSGSNRYRFWSERITTVDGNGFIKRASPIVRVAETDRAMPENFGEGNFVIGLYCSVNDEAEGVTVSKTATGVYEISGTEGPYIEGWTIEIPQDVNGNRLCFAETTFSNGVLILRTFKRKFDLDTASVVAGDPIDIPAGRWVDLRVAMSANSAFNKKAAEAKAILQKQLEDEMSSQEEIDSSQDATP